MVAGRMVRRIRPSPSIRVFGAVFKTDHQATNILKLLWDLTQRANRQRRRTHQTWKLTDFRYQSIIKPAFQSWIFRVQFVP